MVYGGGACYDVLTGEGCGLNIMHLNIQSLNKHFEELEVFVHSFKKIFDVITCTETYVS